ncbi:sulfotransferase family protein [Micromonospora sp. NPDC003816]|uniref:sulfotransferase family protein n=1 Tax=Micromonospora sp. NPDC003816 TaxID=3364224 RepID=UPI0036AE5E5B
MTTDGTGRSGRSQSPVLIIGTERSGSNLLRLVLNAHSRIAVPHPPHFMRYLAPVADCYGDLTDEGNRRRLVDDACLLLDRHISPWPHRVDPDLAVARASPTLFGVVAELYEQYREAEGKARWGCKSTFMVDHVTDVLAEYPAARFVWLVRDPRDVAASARRAVFGHCHPYLTGRLWARQQTSAAAALARHGPDTVHLLRYEDLVQQPRDMITQLCAWLGESPEPALFAHDRTPTARALASLSESWRNAGQPVTTSSVGTWRRRLPPTEVGLVEAAAGPVMAELGYPVDAGPAVPPHPALLRLREGVLRAGVEYRSLRQDRNAVRRWRRDATVRWIHTRARLTRLGARRGPLLTPTA